MNIPKQAMSLMEWNGINNNIYSSTGKTSTSITNHSIPSHSTPLKQEVDRFIAEIRCGGDGAFYDPQYSPVAICLALTASWHSVRRWRQLANALPEDFMRDELAAFWSEIRAGEDVRNRGAALNARLGRKAGL